MLQGYNSTVFAYGVTGAGKTYTIFGDQNQMFAEKGICMYTIDYLFSKINKDKGNLFTIKISYLEIYNEQVFDLLSSKPNIESIMIVEDPTKGVLVPDLSEIIVNDTSEVMGYIAKGNTRRTKGSNNQNQFSSRSHAILSVHIEQCGKNLDNCDILISKMLIADLAGSERVGKEKRRREEGGNINKSLLALGNCINILSDKTKKNSFVPYRNSKLTRLLKDSLGGNTATVMIACVSPSPLTYEETNSTLKYASKANLIKKKITKNFKEIDQSTVQYREIISSLRNETIRLKEIIKEQHMKIKSNNASMDLIIGTNNNMKIIEEKGSDDGSEHSFSSKNGDIGDECYSFDENNADNFNSIDGGYKEEENLSPSNSNSVTVNFNTEIYEKINNQNLKDLKESQIDILDKKLER